MTRGNTPQRSIRADDDLWLPVQNQCAAEGINVSELVRGLLRGWLSGRQDNHHDDEGEK